MTITRIAEFACNGCGYTKTFALDAEIISCPQCGFFGWSYVDAIVPSVLTLEGRIYPPTHAEDLAAMRAKRMGKSVFTVTPGDHLAAQAINEVRSQVNAQAEAIEQTMTPAQWSTSIEKRLHEYEAMGFIDKSDRVRLLNPTCKVGRVINTNEKGDALVALSINQEPEMTTKAINEQIHERINLGSREELFSIAKDFDILLRSNWTDEECRRVLHAAHGRRVTREKEESARTPTNPHASNVQCTIACTNCGHTNVYPLGEMDPKESRCTHRFRFAPELGRMGALICTTCPLRIDRQDLERLNIDPQKRYDNEGNTLADALTMLRAENREVFAENARLRMKVEALERRAKSKR